jgi:hypothetical protein
VKNIYILLLAFVLLFTACSPAAAPEAPSPVPTEIATATATVTATPIPSATPTETPVPPTETPEPTTTPDYPVEGRGPTNFAVEINPLTGLEVQSPEILNRRPVVIKVENLPREHRPQWGLSLADLVYEYYTEFGGTRFAAVFYGSDAERVGPIRSGRFFDVNIVQMYKAVFVYGSAYADVQRRFFNSDFASRLILESSQSCPALCRYDPNGKNYLVANTAELMGYILSRKVDNTRQNLDGMYFQLQPPAGGSPASQVYVRYSGAIYNRWDYDAASGRYLRFSEAANDVNRTSEVYKQLTDRLNDQAITADNVVTVCAPHRYFVRRDDAEVIEIIMDSEKGSSYVGCDGQTYLGGTGAAFIARDGQVYKVLWQRSSFDMLLTLFNEDGTPFPFKPGQTWFEVIGASSNFEQSAEETWRFTHQMVP